MSLPTFDFEPHPKPIYRLVVDGKDITVDMADRLISLTLTDNRGFEADMLDLQLDDTDGLLELPARGAVIHLAIGWAATGLVEKGSYTVDEVEHSGAPDTMTIRARSADLRSGLTTQRERSWHNVTLGDIVRTIADENGLEPAIAGSLAGLPIAHIDQTNETAVNLLSRLAKDHDAISTVKGGRLLFIPFASGKTASGKPLPAITIERQLGDQHRFSIADRESYTGVRALYNDVGHAVKGEITWGKDEDSAEKHEPAKADTPPATGQYKDEGKKPHKSKEAALRAAKKAWNALKNNKAAKGAYIGVKAKYNDRNLGQSGEVTWGEANDKNRPKTGAADPEVTPSAGNIKTLRHVYASLENAKRAARAEWRKIQRGVATFSINLARGRPELFPELPVEVIGFKPPIDNTDWIIAKVTHSLVDSGYTTSIELEIKATEVPD